MQALTDTEKAEKTKAPDTTEPDAREREDAAEPASAAQDEPRPAPQKPSLDKYLAWLEIDLDALRGNLRMVMDTVAPSKVCAVVKADAYGHGLLRAAKAFADGGADMIATANLREALAVRRALPDVPLLVMGLTPEAAFPDAVEADVALTLESKAQAWALSQAAFAAKKTARAHLKLDTGFHRIGMTDYAAVRDAPEISRMPNLSLEGLFTHLALVDFPRDESQMRHFLDAAQRLRSIGIAPQLHAADSIAMFRYPYWRLDMVRAGAVLYGAAVKETPFTPMRAMRLCARVASLRNAGEGEGVGYDEELVLTRTTRIATLAAGYADGLPRRLRGKGEAALRGRRAPYLGLPCMDQLMVDVTDIPEASEGDVVTLFGGAAGSEDVIPYEEFAGWAASNRNEPLSGMGRRVPRAYYEGGELVAVDDPLEALDG